MNPSYHRSTIAVKGLLSLIGASLLTVSMSASAVTWSVPFLKQKDYTGIGESASAPTCVTMLLRYYYPNSLINVPEVYHAGTQQYTYESGPAELYRNVSYTNGDQQPLPNAAIYYKGGDSSAAVDVNILTYLDKIWAIDAVGQLTMEGVYKEIEKGPLLVAVYAYGKKTLPHYMVIRGIDTKNTDSKYDDIIYVHDPYDNHWNERDKNLPAVSGENKAIAFAEFSNRWFRYAYGLTPRDSEVQRAYSVVVDSGHVNLSNQSGNPAIHKLSLETPTAWKFYYGNGGDWFIPTKAGLSAKWTPKLAVSGRYEVSVKYHGDAASGNVAYVIYRGNTKLATAGVKQSSGSPAWMFSILAADIKLQNGDLVSAENIPANTAIDAVKFKYLGK